MAELANVSLIPLRISRDMWTSPYGTEQGARRIKASLGPSLFQAWDMSRIRHKGIRGDLSDARPELIPYRQADRLNAARTV